MSKDLKPYKIFEFNGDDGNKYRCILCQGESNRNNYVELFAEKSAGKNYLEEIVWEKLPWEKLQKQLKIRKNLNVEFINLSIAINEILLKEAVKHDLQKNSVDDFKEDYSDEVPF